MTRTSNRPAKRNPPAGLDPPRPGVCTRAEVVRVIDGDTLVVELRRTFDAMAHHPVAIGDRVVIWIPAGDDGHAAQWDAAEVFPVTPAQPADGPATADNFPAPPCGVALVGDVAGVSGRRCQVVAARHLNLRLLDCWAPESRTRDREEKARGLESKAALQAISPPGTALTVFIPADPRGRISDVFTMGRALAWAWPDDGDPRDLSQRQRDSGHAFATKPEGQAAGNGRR